MSDRHGEPRTSNIPLVGPDSVRIFKSPLDTNQGITSPPHIFGPMTIIVGHRSGRPKLGPKPKRKRSHPPLNKAEKKKLLAEGYKVIVVACLEKHLDYGKAKVKEDSLKRAFEEGEIDLPILDGAKVWARGKAVDQVINMMKERKTERRRKAKP